MSKSLYRLGLSLVCVDFVEPVVDLTARNGSKIDRRSSAKVPGAKGVQEGNTRAALTWQRRRSSEQPGWLETSQKVTYLAEPDPGIFGGDAHVLEELLGLWGGCDGGSIFLSLQDVLKTESGILSDCQHQSACDTSGYIEGYIMRRVRGDMELRNT